MTRFVAVLLPLARRVLHAPRDERRARAHRANRGGRGRRAARRTRSGRASRAARRRGAQKAARARRRGRVPPGARTRRSCRSTAAPEAGDAERRARAPRSSNTRSRNVDQPGNGLERAAAGCHAAGRDDELGQGPARRRVPAVERGERRGAADAAAADADLWLRRASTATCRRATTSRPSACRPAISRARGTRAAAARVRQVAHVQEPEASATVFYKSKGLHVGAAHETDIKGLRAACARARDRLRATRPRPTRRSPRPRRGTRRPPTARRGAAAAFACAEARRRAARERSSRPRARLCVRERVRACSASLSGDPDAMLRRAHGRRRGRTGGPVAARAVNLDYD